MALASCYTARDFLKGASLVFISETLNYFSQFVDHSVLIRGTTIYCIFFSYSAKEFCEETDILTFWKRGKKIP